MSVDFNGITAPSRLKCTNTGYLQRDYLKYLTEEKIPKGEDLITDK